MGGVGNHIASDRNAVFAGVQCMASPFVAPISLPYTPATLPVSGERLIVRPWTRRDRRAMEQWPLPTVHAEWLQVGITKPGPRLSYAIEHGAHPIGRISLREMDSHSARLGIYLRPDYCSQGYGAEGLRLFLGYYFYGLRRQILRLDVASANIRAVRMYERLGFEVTRCEWRAVSTGDVAVFQEMELCIRSNSVYPQSC